MNAYAPAVKRQHEATAPKATVSGRSSQATRIGLPLFMQAVHGSESQNHAPATPQRQCAAGSNAARNAECEVCGNDKRLQAKLGISASDDPLEREADRVADQVLAAPAHAAIGGAPPGIQRFTGQATDNMAAAPASVDRVLASSGRTLEPSLRQDMEQRFGHDFSRVRVHADAAAGQSAREVNAHAYTVGHDIVFGEARFAPGTHEGRRLIAHELTHVVQQQGAAAAGVRCFRPMLQRQSLGTGAGGMDDEGALVWESFRQSITLENFDSDDSSLKPEHLTRLKEYKERFQTLLGRYPDTFISVIGHTDATDTEAHNKTLGQQRADAVKGELTSGDNPLPASIIHAGSLGESMLAVETKGREPRNRRVEVIPRLRRVFKLPLPTPPQPVPGFPSPGGGQREEGGGLGGGPGPYAPGGMPRIPDLKIHEHNWLEDALRKDPIIKSLPDWARKKVVDALKDGDEMLAEKVIDALPLDDKTRAAVQAIVKSLLQMAKGKRFKVPEPPPRQPDFGPKYEFPKMPGEVIIPGPKIPLPF